MSTYSARLTWKRNGAIFTDNNYSRAHEWHFDGGTDVSASSSPQVVPEPYSDPSGVDPEEADFFFERYGEEFDPQTGTGDIEIWIPVELKEQ